MHRVCAMMFEKALGRFLDVFYDDVFIYSHTRRAHLRYLEIVLTSLRHYRFFLSRTKVESMAPSLKALGCIMDDAGVSVDPTQWDSVKNWPVPRNKKDIMRFSGTELLGVLDACLKYRELILGWDVVVVTDHQPLRTYWDQTPKLTRRHIRLWETLSQVSILWDFIPEKLNVFADALSRLAELCAEEEWLSLPVAQEPPPSDDDNSPFPDEPSDRMVLAVMALQSATGRCTEVVVAPVIPGPGESPSPSAFPSILATLPASLALALPATLLSDPLGRKILAAPAQYPLFTMREGLLFRTDGDVPQLYLPQGRLSQEDRAPTFVECVIRQSHDSLGHFEAVKTLAIVRRAYWWPTMHKDVHDYIKSCEVCSRSKSATSKPFGLLHPLVVPLRPWATAGMDFVVGLPPVRYHGEVVDSILLVTDFLSRAVVLIPLPSTASASDVADQYYDSVFRRFGLQDSLVSDRDLKFTSRFWRSLHERLGTELKFSSSAHPQTDGRSEVTNKVVGQLLRSFCEDDQEDWANKIPLVEFSINSSPSLSTALEPFSVLYGFLPSAWPTTPWTTADTDIARRGELARLDWLRCSDALIASRVDMIHSANKRRREESPQFQVGNKVYVSSAGLRFPHSLSGKFNPKFLGPYNIVAANVAKSTFDISFPPHLSLHPRIHSSRLRPFFPNDDIRFPSRSFASPPPAIVAADGNEEYLVEKLVSDRTRYGKREFRMRYLGYSASADDWRPEAELAETAPALLDDYLKLVDARRGATPRGRRRPRQALLAPFRVSSSSSPALPTVVPRRGGLHLILPVVTDGGRNRWSFNNGDEL
ncbi:hypothetical protein JCM11641_000614 [Rhodosporidiobolus odoratus]